MRTMHSLASPWHIWGHTWPHSPSKMREGDARGRCGEIAYLVHGEHVAPQLALDPLELIHTFHVAPREVG